MHPVSRTTRALMAFAAAAVIACACLLSLPPASATAQDGPEQVTVGLYINDIQQLDLHTYTYLIDFYLWLRWRDPDLDPAATIEFMNASSPWDSRATQLYDEPVPQPDGTLYQAIRYQGAFTNKFPLQRYPFDEQSLAIVFEDNTYPQDVLVYVPDDPPVTMNPETDLPGYELQPPKFAIIQQDYPTTFGDLTLDAPAPYSRGNVDIHLTRPPIAAAIKLLLPILLVVLVAALTFFIDPAYPEARVGMGITALLTLVALQFTTNAELPQTDYLIMLDMLYICAYAFVFAIMASAVYTTWMATREELDRAVSFDRKAFAASTAAYLLCVGASMFFFLR
ncbi:MAG: hypothetical protein ACKOWF_19635 [Chloroflexota bacterium]